MSKKHNHHEDVKKEEVKAQADAGEQNLPEDYEPEIEVTPEDVAKGQDGQSEYYDRYVRMCADFDNYRKRTEREKAAFIAYGKKQFAEQLLPAYEVMLRQQEKMDQEEPSENCASEVKNLQTGMKMILSELDKAFKAEGIVRMDVLDKPYDPATQEVVAMIPSSEAQDGLVLQEVQIGFMMDGKVLRPARVIVGQHAEG